MVVMPEYLKSSTKQSNSKPRVISEVKKNCLSKLKLDFNARPLQDFGKSKFSGQLFWSPSESKWVLTMAEVRQGSLILIKKDSSDVDLRLPLRELNLQSCNTPRTFCLTDSKLHRLFTFQAITDGDYEKWIRILAVELIRQTPLQNVRFLDILSIITNKEAEKSIMKRGRSEECVSKAKETTWENESLQPHPPLSCTVRESNEKFESTDRNVSKKIGNVEHRKLKVRIQNSMPVILEKEKSKEKSWMRTQSMSNLVINTKDVSDESGISSGEESPTDSISRNVDDFSFLPVRERKKFFESLTIEKEVDVQIDTSPLARSNSISNLKSLIADKCRFRRRKRTKSLHDLQMSPVREICRLFESRDKRLVKVSQECEKGEKNAVMMLTQRKLQKGERKLEKLRCQITEVEESIKNVAEDLKSIGLNSLKRKDGLELFTALQRRLDEEKSRLDRLNDEMTRVIKGNQRIIMKMEKTIPEPVFSS